MPALKHDCRAMARKCGRCESQLAFPGANAWRRRGRSAIIRAHRPMIPDNLHLGPIPIHIFGVFLALAFLIAGVPAGREFVRRGWDRELASSAVVWAAAGGIVGSRLWYLLAAWREVVADPLGVLLAAGGFVFYGGLAGGLAAMTLFFHRHGIPWLAGADALAPAVALGQAIGRWGCQLSGDGDWGRETTLPWGMAYPHAVAGWYKPPGVVVHPTPIYESAAYFATFALLWRLRRRPLPAGSIFYGYLLLSGTARFAVEFVRINPVVALGLTEAQFVSLGLVIAGATALLTQRAWRPAAA
jgi:phosphatidylglycerol:prolipoprotein diacylglycerol transferase